MTMIARAASLLGLVVAAGCRMPQPCPHPASAPATSASASDPMLAIGTLLPAPQDFARQRLGSPEYPIPPYAKFLKGRRIVLDPGHGGDAYQRGFKRGPTGVREAEMNLRVARYLREFLLAAGCEVRLTRESDHDISHARRAAAANDWPADLFISLHHNAIGNKPQVNYTTVWYHATVEHRPSNLDLARYLCDALRDGLALPQITDVPLKSDNLMYQEGFAVLRHARVTAALCESSFFTNPEEEQRLRDPNYNLREAYHLFLGLARYAAGGWPRVEWIRPGDERQAAARAAFGSATPGVLFELDDGLRGRRAWGHERGMILADTIVVRCGGRALPYRFLDHAGRYLLHVEWPSDLPAGARQVEIQFQNMSKNSVLNPLVAIER